MGIFDMHDMFGDKEVDKKYVENTAENKVKRSPYIVCNHKSNRPRVHWMLCESKQCCKEGTEFAETFRVVLKAEYERSKENGNR